MMPITRSKTGFGAQPMIQIASGERIAAVISRVKRDEARGAAWTSVMLSGIAVGLDEHLRVGIADPAVAPFARLEVDDRLEEMPPAKIGPQHLGHVDLGVGDLPEEEVRDAQLAAGADEQVGVAGAGGVEVIGEEGLVDHGVAHLLLAQQGHDAVAGVDDLGAPAVVEGDLEEESFVVLRLVLGVAELAMHARVEPFDAADGREADVVLHQRGELLPQVLLEQHHERGHFVARTLPVLDGKRVEGDDVELEAGGGLDDLAHRGDAGAVALDAGEVACAGPAAVAVHDDGDVPRQPLQIDFFEERLFDRAGIGKLAKVDHLERAMLAQYRTSHSTSPFAGAVHRASANDTPSRLPRPTSMSVPAMRRTIYRRKPSAVTVMRMTSRSRTTSMDSIVRTVVFTSGDATVNAAKSCVPSSACAASCMRAVSSACATCACVA